MRLLQAAALFLVVAGVVTVGLAATLARSWRAGLRMALDLWLAAALLQLGPDTDGVVLAGIAAIIGVRPLARSPGSAALPAERQPRPHGPAGSGR